jgi:hypothetical protein
MWQIHLVFLHLIVLWYSSPPWLCVPFLHFSHNRSNWSLHPSSKIATSAVLNDAIINYERLVRFYSLPSPSHDSHSCLRLNYVKQTRLYRVHEKRHILQAIHNGSWTCTVINNMTHERKDHTALCSLISIDMVARQLPQPEGNTCSLNKLAVADVPHKRLRSVVHVHAW